MTRNVKKFIEDFIGLIDIAREKELSSLIHHASAKLTYWECVELSDILAGIGLNLHNCRIKYVQEDVRERILELTPSIGESFTLEDLYPESVGAIYNIFDCMMEDVCDLIIRDNSFLCDQFTTTEIDPDLGYVQFKRIK